MLPRATIQSTVFQPPSLDKTFMQWEFVREPEPEVPVRDGPLTNPDDRLRPHHFDLSDVPGPGTMAAGALSTLSLMDL